MLVKSLAAELQDSITEHSSMLIILLLVLLLAEWRFERWPPLIQ